MSGGTLTTEIVIHAVDDGVAGVLGGIVGKVKAANQTLMGQWVLTNQKMAAAGRNMMASYTAPILSGFKQAADAAMEAEKGLNQAQLGFLAHAKGSLEENIRASEVWKDTIRKNIMEVSNASGVEFAWLTEASGLFAKGQILDPKLNAAFTSQAGILHAVDDPDHMTSGSDIARALNSARIAWDLSTAEKIQDFTNKMIVTGKMSKMSTGDVAHALQTVVPIAAGTGLKPEDTLGLIGLQGLAGLQPGTLGAALKSIIASLLTPNSNARAVFANKDIDLSKYLKVDENSPLKAIAQINPLIGNGFQGADRASAVADMQALLSETDPAKAAQMQGEFVAKVVAAAKNKGLMMTPEEAGRIVENAMGQQTGFNNPMGLLMEMSQKFNSADIIKTVNSKRAPNLQAILSNLPKQEGGELMNALNNTRADVGEEAWLAWIGSLPGKLQAAGTAWHNFVIAVGESSAITAALDTIRGLVSSLNQLSPSNINVAVGALMALAATGPALWALGRANLVLTALGTGLWKLSGLGYSLLTFGSVIDKAGISLMTLGARGSIMTNALVGGTGALTRLVALTGRLTAFGVAIAVVYEAVKHWDSVKAAFQSAWNGEAMAKLTADLQKLGTSAGKLGTDLDHAIQAFERMMNIKPGESGLLDALNAIITTADRVTTTFDLMAQAIHHALNPTETISMELATANAASYDAQRRQYDLARRMMVSNGLGGLLIGATKPDMWRWSLGDKAYENEMTHRDRQPSLYELKAGAAQQVAVKVDPVEGNATVRVLIDGSALQQYMAQMPLRQGRASAAAPAAYNDTGGRR